MKKIILTLVFSISGLLCFAQNDILLTVKWNATGNKYEVYAKPTFSASSFNLGSSQISIVVPNSVPDNSFTVTSVNGGVWADQSKVYAPIAQPASDFHGISTTGANLSFTNGVESILFTFTLPGGICVDGVRVFNNGTDPSSTASGMNGGDFKNSLEDGSRIERYSSNFNNTGTQCIICNIVAPELSNK
jgi:hypothetical protein